MFFALNFFWLLTDEMHVKQQVMNENFFTFVSWSEVLIYYFSKLSVEILHLPWIFSSFFDSISQILINTIIPVPIFWVIKVVKSVLTVTLRAFIISSPSWGSLSVWTVLSSGAPSALLQIKWFYWPVIGLLMSSRSISTSTMDSLWSHPNKWAISSSFWLFLSIKAQIHWINRVIEISRIIQNWPFTNVSWRSRVIMIIVSLLFFIIISLHISQSSLPFMVDILDFSISFHSNPAHFILSLLTYSLELSLIIVIEMIFNMRHICPVSSIGCIRSMWATFSLSHVNWLHIVSINVGLVMRLTWLVITCPRIGGPSVHELSISLILPVEIVALRLHLRDIWISWLSITLIAVIWLIIIIFIIVITPWPWIGLLVVFGSVVCVTWGVPFVWGHSNHLLACSYISPLLLRRTIMLWSICKRFHFASHMSNLFIL